MAIKIFPTPNNPIDSLRLNSIMDPSNYQTDTRAPTSVMNISDNNTSAPSSQDDITQRLLSIFQPAHKYDDILSDMLTNMPARNKPGLGRKILAGLAAFSSAKDTDEALYAPYNRQLQDWETKFKPTLEVAKLENTDNTNMRMIANTILSNQMADKRLDRQYARDAVLQGQGDRRLDDMEDRYGNLQRNAEVRIKQGEERLKIAEANAKGGVFKVDDAGNPFIVYKDGSTVPVNAEYLSAQEKADLQVKIAESRARATASGSRQRVKNITIDDPNNPGKSIEAVLNLDTQEVTIPKIKGNPDISPVSPPKSELEKGRATTAKALQVKNEHPEWSKYIKVNGSTINLTSPGYFFGPTQDEYNKMYTAIYGNTPPSNSGVPKESPKASSQASPKANSSYTMTEGTPPPINQRKVGMRHKFPNGNIGEWDGKVWKPVTVVKQ